MLFDLVCRIIIDFRIGSLAICVSRQLVLQIGASKKVFFKKFVDLATLVKLIRRYDVAIRSIMAWLTSIASCVFLCLPHRGPQLDNTNAEKLGVHTTIKPLSGGHSYLKVFIY